MYIQTYICIHMYINFIFTQSNSGRDIHILGESHVSMI